jgi:prepilin-type processing-associated H-X9-DG protein
LLVTLGIITVLLGLILAGISKARTAAQSAKCLANLHQIAVGFQQYAADNGRLLPDPTSSSDRWEQLLTNGDYLTNANVFRCPADEEAWPNIGSSYDWRDTGRPETTLAGKSIGSELVRTNPVLAFETLPGWHAKKKMNAVFLDGSAQTMDQAACLGDLVTPIRSVPGVTIPPPVITKAN